jgi:cobalt/nickel transport system permease protein
MKPDPRAALLLLLAYLIVLSSLHSDQNFKLFLFCLFPVALLTQISGSKSELLAQAAYVLPFSLAIAMVAFLRGNAAQAVFFLVRSYFSILSVLLVTRIVSTIDLLRAMERLGAPRFLIIVTEFLVRYLDVLRNEADAMRLAALCRGGAQSQLIAASSLGMLFVRSLERSTSIHTAMLARGFHGTLPRLHPMQWRIADTAALLLGISSLVALRWMP